jgi:hydrogenase maturation factor
LFSAPDEKVNEILEDLHNVGLLDSKVIGSVTEYKGKHIYLNS